ncbi:helix-turn-helix domain-containing protein [Streptomyces katrae]|uniref:XRE family transcriptional regulator n=1 Tax=Streptomyces katrae TaxID=68223 RepID=A0A0F4JBQ6_9ACTN|nr:helix-turn-helix transcriptional regulator [Streptomyces katrae]KJY31625.1 XRE family transcriptional regulator [Streptomyces katrae]
MDTRRIGENIACWRGRRRLTQTAFGTLMGKSKRWVQDLEAGSRQADPRLSVLEAAARVLAVPLPVLLADTTSDETADAAGEMEAIRVALHRHDIATGTPDASAHPLDVDTLRRSVHHAWRLFQASAAFTSLSGRIPALLTDATHAAALHDGDDQLTAYRALSMTLQLTEALAIKAGATDIASLAGHRAVLAAERSGDPVIQASAARHLTDALTADEQPHAAAAFAQAAATRLTPDLTGRGAVGLSTLGMLYLKAAMAQATAATLTDRRAPSAARQVPDLLAQADEHARQLPPDADGNALFTAFNTTNVSLYRLAAHVKLYEGEAGAAVAQAITADQRAALPRERRAHLLTDLAHAYTQAGNRQKAVDTLLDAEREAPEEVLGRPRTHQLVEDLRLLGAGSAEGRLRALAERCGLPG